MKKEIIIFDLDGTLTESRQEISRKMQDVLFSLEQTIAIISGATFEQMQKQFQDILLANYKTYVMPQSGNILEHLTDTIWENKMGWKAKKDALNHIQFIIDGSSLSFKNPNDIVEDRGSQISFSLLGHNAPIEDKNKFDPDSSKRIKYLAECAFYSSYAEVRIGGTTCLDYTEKGRNKGTNIKELLGYLKLKPEQAIYFGDKLMPGGNDETVVGVCEVVQVDGPEDTLRKIKEITI